MRLSPREPTGTPLQVIGGAYFFKRDFDTAVSKLLLAIQDNPGVTPAYRTLAACYAHMGRLDDAREVVMRLRTITAKVVPDVGDLLPWRRPGDADLFISGLEMATSVM
jgi:adenylate cyclase